MEASRAVGIGKNKCPASRGGSPWGQGVGFLGVHIWNMGSGSSGRFLSLGIHAKFYHSLKAGVQWTAEALCWVGSGCTLSQPLKWNLHCLRSGTYEKEISWLKCRCVSLLAALVPVLWLRKVSISCLSKVILLFQKNPTHSVVKYTHIYIFNFVSFLEQPK